MTLVETQHRLALEQPRRAGEQPVSLAALRAAGLDWPAAVIRELELNGYASSECMTADDWSACA